jgi:hypothetical protein
LGFSLLTTPTSRWFRIFNTKARRLFYGGFIGNNRISLFVRNGIWYKTVVDDAGRLNSWLPQPTMITICSWNTMHNEIVTVQHSEKVRLKDVFKADEILR